MKSEPSWDIQSLLRYSTLPYTHTRYVLRTANVVSLHTRRRRRSGSPYHSKIQREVDRSTAWWLWFARVCPKKKIRSFLFAWLYCFFLAPISRLIHGAIDGPWKLMNLIPILYHIVLSYTGSLSLSLSRVGQKGKRSL
jgi:hypothetical protein